MLNNHTFNLVQYLVDEQKTLRRIREKFKNDAETCPMCTEYWKNLEKEKAEQVKKLKHMVKEHLNKA
ncbi:MAG: hypothetical protein ACW976_07215 [Candidatus Ranarchaeia archaeon]